jgi:3-deoxy-manno-octulosonate cytidylyltransferase (CMP-KDO synthetase)
MRIAAIIPARFGSTRFPGKPLVALAGKAMVVRVAEQVEKARQAGFVERVLVATDDPRIRDVVQAAGFEVCLTSPHHPTGTDRLAEVARDLDADVVCNIQGDEPLLEPEVVAALVGPLRDDPGLSMGTVKTPLARPEDRFDPNRAKLVVDSRERALTFTRLPIVEGLPAHRDYFNRSRVEAEHARAPLEVFCHVGVYAYRREFLLEFAGLPQTRFERAERLEQLRALEHGFAVSAPTVAHRALPVDTPEDAARVEAVLRAEGR